MTYVLGISAFYHDSTAALIIDGNIISAAQEERFSRKKHDSRYPFNAIEFVLKNSKVKLSQVDYIVFFEKPSKYWMEIWEISRFLETFEDFGDFSRIFNDFEEIFDSYRSKKVFSRIADIHLNEYINSIFEKYEDRLVLYKDHNPAWEEIMYLTAGIKDFDIWKNLHRLKTPTLIIIPETSPVLRYHASKKISKNRLIEIKILKESTHLFPLEKPKETSKIILDFFSK